MKRIDFPCLNLFKVFDGVDDDAMLVVEGQEVRFLLDEISLCELDKLSYEYEELPDYIKAGFVSLVVEIGMSLEDVITNQDNIYFYKECYSMTDVAREWADTYSLLNLPLYVLERYFNYEAFGRELAIDGIFVEGADGMLVYICK